LDTGRGAAAALSPRSTTSLTPIGVGTAGTIALGTDAGNISPDTVPSFARACETEAVVAGAVWATAVITCSGGGTLNIHMPNAPAAAPKMKAIGDTLRPT
jgi:hypothetical protein